MAKRLWSKERTERNQNPGFCSLRCTKAGSGKRSGMSLIWKWSEVVGHARGDVQQADLSSDLKVKMNLRLERRWRVSS